MKSYFTCYTEEQQVQSLLENRFSDQEFEETYVPQYFNCLLTVHLSIDTESGIQKDYSSVKSSASTQKPPKYRLACDSCQHSKIRCDQKRPKCRRCAKKGIDCVYSPARRAGRPRTRNNSKNSQSAENSAPASSKEDSVPATGSGITDSASLWMWTPHSMMADTSAVPIMMPTIQGSSSDSMDFSPSQLSDDTFRHSLSDLTSSHSDTSKEMGNCYSSMSPEFHIAPEPLGIDFCETTWGHQQQQQQQQLHTSTAILLDEGVSYCELLTPNNHHQQHHLDQQHEEPPVPTTSGSNTESCSYNISPQQQQTQPQFPNSLDNGTPSKISCNCASALLDHLSASSKASPTSCFASTPTALSISQTFITSCRNMMKCPNACYMQPSITLVICEAINRALVALKLGGISLWTSMLEPMPNYENGTSSSPSSSSSCSISDTSSDNATMLPSVDDEHEPLRCGTLPIRGADRRVMVRVLLVKRMLEMQGVLERLRDMLVSELLVIKDSTVKKKLLALCADIVDQSAKKVAEKVKTVKLQM
ncbi:hypothetical protein COCC4DRAFT_131093 [Bipolaris maydis ATCC 48331]|uniref:Zn(2)-C6 fungal-type domain-containing protein n=2 Tax=Cochliobolus heterostrophus TaxID=5016 RepID=M2UEX6_COCH5|nr:uncharacterized protein COCC4DRAFT_131093 [Bipolaris maydis ATCC 48331]EMD92241.1 hypothetical protein COCHEDRAFT_1155229 [Bipolaris maydis C5]KAJ5022096.1 hypothetical protein J3E73DRAFT_394006 [Bipolaris maydis]ENI07935.1 hypothetical protein COCC4DRAFT_131093 [Bipolaris maydis ATCC 48331]KAJ6210044.1 hypothetical protein PSV09DRAFT_1155229 [Bipolaris maydis]KAJ6272405.1 hypothetical protein PSV08DRAFT_370411 [Bipolaris maydis]